MSSNDLKNFIEEKENIHNQIYHKSFGRCLRQIFGNPVSKKVNGESRKVYKVKIKTC